MMHVSNRHMELSSVVAGIAHANGLVSRVNNRAAHEGEDDSKYMFTSTVVINAREDSDFGSLREDPDWLVVEPPAGQRIWTDDYSNVIGAVIRQYRKTSCESGRAGRRRRRANSRPRPRPNRTSRRNRLKHRLK
jgi:hypothetical protein